MARVGGSSLMALKKKIISKFFNYRMTDNDSCSFRNSNFINCSVDVSELNGVRSMHIGSETIQSSMNIADPFFLELNYTKAMSLCFVFNKSPKEILVVGLGGGSIAKFFYKHSRKSVINIVELNSQVINVAKAYFKTPQSKRFNIIEGDAIRYLFDYEMEYDILLSDAFDDIGIPENFCTMEYFSLCKSRLSQHGIFMINLWGSDPKTMLYIDRIKSVFDGRVLYAATDNPGNIIVFAFNSLPSELRIASLKLRIKDLEKQFNLNLMVYFKRLIESSSNSNERRIKFE